MIGHSKGQALAAYQSVATHGGVAAADQHGLILMLIDGVLERVAGARAAIVDHDMPGKARLLNRALVIVDELRGSLDFEAGGQVARNLDSLYEYCSRRMLAASVGLNAEPLDEVVRLLSHIRGSWVAARDLARSK